MTQNGFAKAGQKCSEIENKRQYNFIYEKIVTEPDDAIGLVAYGLYKQKKIEYIQSIRKEHGRDITDEERADFHRVSCQHVEGYRRDAEELMAAVIEDAYGDALQEAAVSFDNELKERLKGTLKTGVLASVLGSFVTALIIALLYLGSIGYRLGWAGLYRAAMVDAAMPHQQAPLVEKPDLQYAVKDNATSE